MEFFNVVYLSIVAIIVAGVYIISAIDERSTAVVDWDRRTTISSLAMIAVCVFMVTALNAIAYTAEHGNGRARYAAQQQQQQQQQQPQSTSQVSK